MRRGDAGQRTSTENISEIVTLNYAKYYVIHNIYVYCYITYIYIKSKKKKRRDFLFPYV